MSLFATLNKINVSNHVEKKGNLSYLSWAWAWTKINENCEEYVKQNIYKDANGRNYHTDGSTCWVEVGIEADGLEHIEMLPIMDFRNKSIPLANVTSMDVNKAIQRAGTKAIARHGLGMYIYAGEDLPEDEPTASYKTQSKSTAEEKVKYWEEFCGICGDFDVKANDFLQKWANIKPEDQNGMFNAVSKYLKDKDMFRDQLANFKAINED